MSNSESRKRLAEAQRGDEAGDVQLMYLLTRNMNNLYGTRDRVHAAILASDWLAARDAEQRRLGAEAVVAAVEGSHVAAIDNVCAMCRVVDLPCPTIRAARAAAQQASER